MSRTPAIMAALVAMSCSFDGTPPPAPGADAGTSDAPIGDDAGVSVCTNPPPPAPTTMCAGPGVIRDDFNSTTPNPFWVGTNSPVFDGQTLSMTNAGGMFVGVSGKRAFNLTGSSVEFEVVETLDNGVTAFLQLQYPGEPNLGFSIFNTTLTTLASLSSTPHTFDPVAHRFLRIRHDTGLNLLQYETSADSVVWNNLTSSPTPATIIALTPVLGTFSQSDTGSDSTAQFDNFNIGTPAQPWCGLSTLDIPSSPTAALDWRTQVVGALCTVSLVDGVTRVDHEVGSTNCIAQTTSRKLYQLDHLQRVELQFELSSAPVSPGAFFELVGVSERPDGDPRYAIEIAPTQLCAEYRDGGPDSQDCIARSGQTHLAIERDCDDIVFHAGTAGNLVEFARFAADFRHPLAVSMGSESFSVPNDTSPMAITFSDVVIQ